MQSIRVKRASFKQDGISIYDHPVGTVEVSIGNTTIEARARLHGREDISVAGFIGRYANSSNAWPASLITDGADDKLLIHFGRDDRSLRFNKRDAISYEPDVYAQIAHMRAFEAD